MYSLNNKYQYFLKLKSILSFGFFALMTVSVIAQAPDCSIITYNSDAQSRLEIDNLDRLQCMSEDLTADYILLNDIDASPTQTWNEEQGFTPVGTYENFFSGSFNGNGFSVSNLYIKAELTYVGLFGVISGSSEVSNLGMENADISGIAAVGGIAGGIDAGTISQSFVTGSVKGITVANQAIGGLVGYYIGLSGNGSIINSYNTAMVSGQENIGGLVGLTETTGSLTISFSYSSGQIVLKGEGLAGGLEGSGYASIGNSYWNPESSGIGVGFGGGFGFTTAEMKAEISFTGWDFAITWAIDEGNSYPYLQNNIPDNLPGINDASQVTPFSGGIGTGNEPFLIENISQLQALEDYRGYNFELISDIDASITETWNEGAGFDPIGNSSNIFYGILNGNGFIITGLTINRPDSNYVGLFAKTGFLNSGGIGLEEVDITGNNFVGAFSGSSGGSLSSIYVTGSIQGEKVVGGLVGRKTENSSFVNYSLASVTGDSAVGGLIGINESTVNQSYSAGKVVGNTEVGGLIGSNTGEVNDSYWNVESSGQVFSAGGNPLNTSQMKLSSSYNNWSFDFAWDIIETESFPYFQIFPQTPPPGIDFAPQFEAGAGTRTEPFQIRNATQFQNIRNNPSAYFILNENINASATALWNDGLGFDPIGSHELPFKGVVDGNGYTVSAVNINSPEIDTVGVFSVIGKEAIIRNLGLKGIKVEGRNVVGGLAGYTADSSQIEQVYVTGNISGSNEVGGLVGANDGDVRYAYTLSSVNGSSNVGGVAGAAGPEGSITETYAAGNVQGGSNVGGLLGQNDTNISKSYWNTSTAGVLVGSGSGVSGDITGLTTEELMDPNSLIDWDFGFEGIWSVDPGNTYPWLQNTILSPAPLPVILISPANATDIDIPSQLEWKAFPEASYYEIQIATDASMESVIFDTTNIQGVTLGLISVSTFEEGQTYYWKVRPDNANWSSANQFTVQLLTSTESGSDIPHSYALSQNYPNPFNPNTSIRFSVPENSHVNLEVFDLLGRRISKLIDEDLAPGNYSVKFEASNFSSGVYIYRIKSGDFVSTKKMLLLK